jgi:hypothetical protein
MSVRVRVRFNLGKWARRHCERTGRTPNGDRVWTRWEVDLLALLYPDYSLLMRKLPHRTRIAIERHCGKLGLPAEHGRTRRRYTRNQKRILMVLFQTLTPTELQVTCEAIGLSDHQIRKLAEKAGIRRPRKPFVSTEHHALNDLRRRCFAHGVTLVEIDEWTGATGYFTKGWRRKRGPDPRLLREAHAVLDALRV